MRLLYCPLKLFVIIALTARPAASATKLLVLEPTSDPTEVTAARTIGNLVVVELSHQPLIDVIKSITFHRAIDNEPITNNGKDLWLEPLAFAT